MGERVKIVLKGMLLLIAAVVLSINMMEGAEDDFQKDSEALVVGPIAADIFGQKIDTGAYGLGVIIANNCPEEDVYFLLQADDCGEFTYWTYQSQVGLQGMVFRAAAQMIPRFRSLRAFRTICSFLLVVCLMAIVWQLYKKYGLLLAAVFGFVTMTSPWVINFSVNLYWVEFTWFVPMLLGLLCLNYKSKRKYIYPFFFAAIFVKCLCGYEYLSTIMMGSILFLLAEWICSPEDRKDTVKCIFIIGVLSVAGFLAAYMLHAFIYGSGNLAGGLKMLQLDLVERRTYGNPADFANVNYDVNLYSLQASPVEVLRRYFWSKGNPLDGKLMMLIILSTTMALAVKKIRKQDIKLEASLFVFSLLTTLSWLVLGKAHSFVHTHMNFVLFYFGWVQISLYILVGLFADLIKEKSKRAGELQ